MCQKYEETWMAKTDLKDAFLSVPVHIDDHHLLGLSIKNDKGETPWGGGDFIKFSVPGYSTHTKMDPIRSKLL